MGLGMRKKIDKDQSVMFRNPADGADIVSKVRVPTGEIGDPSIGRSLEGRGRHQNNHPSVIL